MFQKTLQSTLVCPSCGTALWNCSLGLSLWPAVHRPDEEPDRGRWVGVPGHRRGFWLLSLSGLEVQEDFTLLVSQGCSSSTSSCSSSSSSVSAVESEQAKGDPTALISACFLKTHMHTDTHTLRTLSHAYTHSHTHKPALTPSQVHFVFDEHTLTARPLEP